MRTFSRRCSYGRRIVVSCLSWSAFSAAPARCLAVAAAAPPGHQLTSEGYFVQGEGNVSIIAQSASSDSPGTFFRAFGFSGKGGHRWRDKAVFVTLEGAFWRSPLVEGGSELVMATNLGVGGEILSAGGMLRTSLAFGPSILTIPPKVDEAGKVGIFLDFRPIGGRFRLSPALVLGVDPLSFHLSVPVLTGIPLIEIEYRTSVYVEHAF
jgi:hypothetical protein